MSVEFPEFDAVSETLPAQSRRRHRRAVLIRPMLMLTAGGGLTALLLAIGLFINSGIRGIEVWRWLMEPKGTAGRASGAEREPAPPAAGHPSRTKTTGGLRPTPPSPLPPLPVRNPRRVGSAAPPPSGPARADRNRQAHEPPSRLGRRADPSPGEAGVPGQRPTPPADEAGGVFGRNDVHRQLDEQARP